MFTQKWRIVIARATARSNPLFYLFLFATLILLFNACSKTNSTDAWREANTNAYDAVVKNSDYRELKTESGPSGVYYKIINSGTGTEYPLQTGKVKILYKGSYYDGTIFDVGSSQNDVSMEFSLTPPSSYAYSPYTPANISRGLSFALQNMVVGDKWEVWIPYYLGYGAVGLVITNPYTYAYQTVVQAYSALVYEVELVGITQYP